MHENELPMRVRVNQTTIELLQGDITQQDTDAIVNTANNSLLGGGGVDGAIHRAAGPQLLAETRTLGGCETGDAKISKGYNLKARYVIHAVGPIYRADDDEAPRLLASAYRRSLEVAVENHLSSVAFPAISTGVFRYPLNEAAHIALSEAIAFARTNGQLSLIRFVLFNGSILNVFAMSLNQLVQSADDIHVISSDDG